MAPAPGLSIARWKATAFLLGNAMIGVAGALYGMMNGFANPNSANFGDSLIMLSILVLGGLGNLWGAVVAAVVILVIPEKLQAIQNSASSSSPCWSSPFCASAPPASCRARCATSPRS